MKSPENCFAEIVDQVRKTINEGEYLVEDDGEYITSSICFSKIESIESNFVFEGFVDLESSDARLHYFFSNKRSYISIDKNNMSDVEVAKFQYCLLILIDKLFVSYKIDCFVYGLISETSELYKKC